MASPSWQPWLALLEQEHDQLRALAHQQLAALVEGLMQQRLDWATLLEEGGLAVATQRHLDRWVRDADDAHATAALSALLTLGLPEAWQQALVDVLLQPQPRWGALSAWWQQGGALPKTSDALWAALRRPVTPATQEAMHAVQAHPQGTAFLTSHAEAGWSTLLATPWDAALTAEGFAFWARLLQSTGLDVIHVSALGRANELAVFYTDHILVLTELGIPLTEVVDQQGRQGWHHAARLRDAHRLRQWLQLQAPMRKDHAGNTPLHYYFQPNKDSFPAWDAQVVRELLDAGHSAQALNWHGEPVCGLGSLNLTSGDMDAPTEAAQQVLAQALALQQADALNKALEDTLRSPSADPGRHRPRL